MDLVPACPALEFWQIFAKPSLPEGISQELNLAPTLLEGICSMHGSPCKRKVALCHQEMVGSERHCIMDAAATLGDGSAVHDALDFAK